MMDANTHEGAMALRALYIIAHDIIHADGVEEQSELQMVVRLVRQALGNPEFSATFIIQQYREHANRPLRPEALSQLSADYRAALMICAGRIAASDNEINLDEGDMMEKLAKRLDMPANWAEQMVKGLRGGDLPQAEVIAIESMCSEAWARGILEVDLEADDNEIKQAKAKLLAQCDPATEEGKEKIKTIEEASAVLLGGQVPPENEDEHNSQGD